MLLWVRQAWPPTLLFTLLNEYADDKEIVLFSLLVATTGARICVDDGFYPYEAVLKRVGRLHRGDVAINRMLAEIAQPLVLEQWMNTPDVLPALADAATPASSAATSELSGDDTMIAELIASLKSVPTLQEKPHTEVLHTLRRHTSDCLSSLISHRHRGPTPSSSAVDRYLCFAVSESPHAPSPEGVQRNHCTVAAYEKHVSR